MALKQISKTKEAANSLTYSDAHSSVKKAEVKELDFQYADLAQEEKENDFKAEDVSSQYRLLFAYYRDLNSEGLLTKHEEFSLSAQKKICREKAALISKQISKKEKELSSANKKRLETLMRLYEERAFNIREKFIKSNLRFVIDLANRYQSRGLPLSDLIQEGNIGLIKAVEKYDHTKGFKFSTYSAWWIHQSLSRAIMEKTRVISIPVYLQEKSSIVYKAKNKLEHNREKKADSLELAKESGLSKDVVDTILQGRDLTVPIELSGGDQDNKSYLDIVPDHNSKEADYYINQDSMVKRLRRSFKVLSDREKDIVKMRYGIGYKDEHKLEQIGIKYGLSRERIRQIETVALKKIADSNEGKVLKEFLT